VKEQIKHKDMVLSNGNLTVRKRLERLQPRGIITPFHRPGVYEPEHEIH
jgi:hypothetical protein